MLEGTMSDGSNATPPGWLYAEGDPPGTVRYWNGVAWEGEPKLTGPQPSAPPFPGQPQTAGQPQPKKSKAKWVLLVVLAAALLVGGCIFTLVTASAGQTEAAEAFLVALDSQDFEAVEATLDVSCFSSGELEQIPTNFRGFEMERIQEIRSEGFTVSGGGTTGDVVADVELRSGEVVTAEIFMTKDPDWKVCGFDFGLSSGRGE